MALEGQADRGDGEGGMLLLLSSPCCCSSSSSWRFCRCCCCCCPLAGCCWSRRPLRAAGRASEREVVEESEGGRGRPAARRLVVEDADRTGHIICRAAGLCPGPLGAVHHPARHLHLPHVVSQALAHDPVHVRRRQEVVDPVRPQHEAEDGRGLEGQVPAILEVVEMGGGRR